tara:strand:- start:392 stop:622 length:231 start_codon:yes stop_codon:yes gene_type:complete
MKKIMIIAMVLFSTSALAEDKSITPKEFANNVSEVPGKLVTFFQGEVEKTKAYQTKVWSEAKTKWPWTMFKGKNND